MSIGFRNLNHSAIRIDNVLTGEAGVVHLKEVPQRIGKVAFWGYLQKDTLLRSEMILDRLMEMVIVLSYRLTFHDFRLSQRKIRLKCY